MRITRFITTLALAVAGALGTADAQAQVVQEVSFQGRLTNNGGTPITASTSVTFRIWTASTGGSNLWTETQIVTPNTNGIYAVRLGSVTAFGAGVTWNATYFLGITVGADAEMLPRYQLTSSPFALNADQLDGLDSTAFLQGAANSAWGSSTGAGTFTLGDATGGADTITVQAGNTFAIAGTLNIGGSNAGANVTGTNLNALTGGTSTNLHTHFGQTWNGNDSARGLLVDNSSSASGADGIIGEANSTSGAGVVGSNTATTGNAVGVSGVTSSTNGIGVQGGSSAGSGVNGNTASGDGVYGLATTGRGVRGYANSTGTGVYGQSQSGTGGFFETLGGSLALDAWKPSASAVTNYGLRVGNAGGSSSGTADAHGIFSEVTRTNVMGNTYGVFNRVRGNSATDTNPTWGIWNELDSGVTSGNRIGFINQVMGNATNTGTVWALSTWAGNTTNRLNGAGITGIESNMFIIPTRASTATMYAYDGFLDYAPSVANSTTIYGVRQDLSLGSSATGNSYAGYFSNTGAGPVAGNVATGVLARSSPFAGTSIGIDANPAKPTNSANAATMYAFYSNVIHTPTVAQNAPFRGVFVEFDGDGSTNYAGWPVAAELTVRANNTQFAYGTRSEGRNLSSGTGGALGLWGNAVSNAGVAYGVFGLASSTSGTAWAGFFSGNANVSGTLSKGAGTFLIDHPLDPNNKILRHSFVESPEMLNIYKGRAKLVDGELTVTLPEWFDALNHADTREVVFTCKRGWSPLYLVDDVTGNQFTVRTTPEGDQGQEFSWVVYAVRDDTFARDNPVIVEEEKGVGNSFEKGRSVHEIPSALEADIAKSEAMREQRRLMDEAKGAPGGNDTPASSNGK